MTVLGWHGAHDARIWKSHLRTRVPVTTGQSWLSGCAALEHPMMDVQEKRRPWQLVFGDSTECTHDSM